LGGLSPAARSTSPAALAQVGFFDLTSIFLCGRTDDGGYLARRHEASTFNTLFVFVFYFSCAAWVTSTRIAAAELAAKEQMLRIEYRLADLAERLAK
jgi:hypothetical protein